MLCQFCGKHEATNKFQVNFMGQSGEVFLCDECLKNFSKYASRPNEHHISMSKGKFKEGQIPSWSMESGSLKGRDFSSESFNLDSGNEIRMKRKLNQLHKQLSNAVEAERYEDAAELRDQINEIKKEVFINGK